MFRKANNGYDEINPVNTNKSTSTPKKSPSIDTSSKDEAIKISTKKFTLYGTSVAPQTKTPEAPAAKSLINRLFGFN